MKTNDDLGRPSPFACPECHGALWEIDDGRPLRYRCHVGHTLTAEAMQASQARQAEEPLRGLLRTRRERAAPAERMAEQECLHGHEDMAYKLRLRASEYQEGAEIIRRLLRSGRTEDMAADIEEGT